MLLVGATSREGQDLGRHDRQCAKVSCLSATARGGLYIRTVCRRRRSTLQVVRHLWRTEEMNRRCHVERFEDLSDGGRR